jgi:uncharacterized repeat protein (TIGR01451 family)
MKNKTGTLLAVAVIVGMFGLLTGCATNQSSLAQQPDAAAQETIEEPTVGMVTETVVEEPDNKVERSVSWAGYTPEVMDKMNVTEVSFPTGNKNTSAIMVHQVMPVEVLKDGVYTYEYHVTNLTGLTHQNVMIVNEGARNLEIVSSTPPVMKGEDGSLRWMVGDLAPQQTEIVRVRATSGAVGTASDCVSVTYENSMCAVTKVVDPDLLLIKTAKTDGNICEDFWFTYEVINPGSGMANNIRIRDEIPSGLRTVEGNQTVVEIDAGNLAPGERRKFTVEARGVETGRHTSVAVATADGGLISESENIETLIYQPVLTVSTDSRDIQYLGRNVEHFYSVKNIGDTVAENTVLTVDLPGGGAQFMQASDNGVADGATATWQIGSLGINESKTVSVAMKATAVETIRSTVSASAECAEKVTDIAVTEILGIPAILTTLVDAGDPAEIGDVVTYTITVVNQGSAPDTNIKIVADIPAEMEYLSTVGPTDGVLNGRKLSMAPVAFLGVGEQIQYNVQVRARSVGDVRFGVSLTSDQLKTPVSGNEATTLY